MRRRRAWLLTLVLIAGLAILCCACGHIATHRCDHGPRCPICECVRLGLRGFILLALALSLLGVTLRLHGIATPLPAMRVLSLYDKRVRLND